MRMNRRYMSTKSAGFSLIEVTIAMAIAAVGVVTLLGLIPQGMQAMQDAGDQAIEGRIHQQILNELQMTPYEEPGGASPLDYYDNMEFYYDVQGEEISNSKNQGTVKDEMKKGGFNHIYSARVTVPRVAGGSLPSTVDGAPFNGYSFGSGSPANPFVRPVIVEIAAVGGLASNFNWDDEKHRRLISTYQSIVVKMGQDYSAKP